MKRIYPILLSLSACYFVFSCKKTDVPGTVSLITTPVGNITDTNAVSGGVITIMGNVQVTARGSEWDTSTRFNNARISSDGTGAGNFSSNLTGLLSNTTYYVRAYAVKSSDTLYGNVAQFTTSYIPGKYNVTTFAGTGVAGATDGDAGSATFSSPEGIAVDAAGNVYVADGNNHRIRKISPGGIVSTLAVTDGEPSDVAVDAIGNVYVSEDASFKILKITAAGTVTTFAGSGTYGSADGMGVSASFSDPVTLDIDAAGNLYVGDDKAFRKISPVGVVTTLHPYFQTNRAIAVDKNGNIYESNFYAIYKIDPSGTESLLAGGQQAGLADGTGSSAGFNYIDELKSDPIGNIYVADSKNNKIRLVSSTGVVTTLAGTGAQGSKDGNSAIATFSQPTGLAIDNAGNIYVADLLNNKIRKISPL